MPAVDKPKAEEPPKEVVGMRLDNAIEFIKGKKGTEVRLTVKKVDGSINVISIIRIRDSFKLFK